MNAEKYDIEQMRKAWIEMGRALGMETQPSNPDHMNKMTTALDRLCDRYRRECDWSIVGAILLAILFFIMPSLQDEYRLPLAITSAIVMLANAYMLYWLWRGIRKIDPLIMSITQVSSMARYYKKCHLLYILIGFPVAITWIGYFMYTLIHSGYGGIVGLVTGSIIGGIFGLYGLWQYLNDYRNLSE